jgi:glyoxylase-like metal-dependent hydrolase (beta-lactamase superfamily II)
LLDDGRLFCGDAAMNRFRFAETRYHTIYVADLGQYYESWRTIVDSGARTVFPAHGDPFDVDRLQEHLGAYDENDLIQRDPITSRYVTFAGDDSNA